MKDPFAIIKCRHVTEKTATLESLHTATSNRSLERCKSPKYVFIVDPDANKHQIAEAVMLIYKDHGIKVTAVNTLHVKPKRTGRRRGRPGKTVAFKKAIVTLAPGNEIDSVSS